MLSRTLISGVLFLIVVTSMTWPLAMDLTSTATTGFESSKTVLLLNEWTIGWNANRLAHGWRGYWTAPHFFPHEQSFGLSEPILTTQFVAPLVWLSGSPVVAYNVFLLGSLVLNGWMTWWVLVNRGCHWLLAMFGGWSMIGLPFVFEQLGVLQSVSLAGILATIHFSVEALETHRQRSCLGAGLCLGLTYWTCSHYGLFLALLLAATASVTHGHRLLSQCYRRFGKLVNRANDSGWAASESLGQNWRPLGIGVAAAVAMIGPISLCQSRALSDLAFERPHELIRDLSALPSDYLATPFPELCQFISLSQWHDHSRWALSPGLWKSLLAFAGVCLGLSRVCRRSWTMFLSIMTLAAFVASFGLNLQIAGWCPYELLLDWVPGMAKVRAPGRFAIFVQIGVVLLSLEALQVLYRWSLFYLRTTQRSFRHIILSNSTHTGPSEVLQAVVSVKGQSAQITGRLAVAAVWCAGLLACCEVRLPAIQLVNIPAAQINQDWIAWLTQNTPHDAVIAHLPFPSGKSPRDYESEAWAMYWSLFHGRRIVNGYSGFFPASYLKLKHELQYFPEGDSIVALRNSGVRYCVIAPDLAKSGQFETHRLMMENMELVKRGETTGTLIYQLIPTPLKFEQDEDRRRNK